MTKETIPRRKFLWGAGLAGTAVAAGMAPDAATQAQSRDQVQDQVQAKPASGGQGAASAADEPEPQFILTPTEHAFVVAAVDTLSPADDLSPSGSECGIATFIDRQLASAWGAGGKMYRAGPFRTGTPEQGYQLPLTPAEFFAVGIAAANTWSRETYGHDFDQLSAEKRAEALKAMQDGKAQFADFNSRAFFARLLAITMEGFFSDPIYGGNRNMAGWRMIGFPGLPATYRNLYAEYRDKPYAVEPRSIADFS